MDLDFKHLYEKYAPMVYRRCFALLKDESHANDAVHEVFVILMQKKNDIDLRGPSSFFYTVATNVCISLLRKNKTRYSVVDETAVDLVETIACDDRLDEKLGASRVLDWLFNRHPETTKLIAILHFVDGLTLEEVAQEVGMSASGVRKRIYKLRKELQQIDGYPHEKK